MALACCNAWGAHLCCLSMSVPPATLNRLDVLDLVLQAALQVRPRFEG